MGSGCLSEFTQEATQVDTQIATARSPAKSINKLVEKLDFVVLNFALSFSFIEPCLPNPSLPPTDHQMYQETLTRIHALHHYHVPKRRGAKARGQD
ncbi:hypothetical protein RUM43_011621 [Polyplax serrata]|uniref:Uncharacterized protein n=1 Tax=Polyplax serrata TaxID=468196 RepID=A0AAN8S0F2_POLSC